MMRVLDNDLFLDQFERLAHARSAREPHWLSEARRAAIRHYTEMGLPTTDQEEWRFTPIGPIAETRFVAPAPVDHTAVEALKSLPFGVIGARRIVIEGGRVRTDLSDSAPAANGLYIASLQRAIEEEPELCGEHLTRYARTDNRAFAALNTALFTDGVIVAVSADSEQAVPIHIVHLADGTDGPATYYPRVLVIVERGAHLDLVETFHGAGASPYLTNSVIEFAVGPNASVEHCKAQLESVAGYHISSTSVRLERDARFRSTSVTFGGAIVRNDIDAALDAEGIECTLNGLYLVDGRRLVDNHTFIDHAQPHCASHELYKGVIGGRGRGVFNGKIMVRQDAQKTDAKQTNQALLLSDDAQINTKPQLEIFADDVKCTHGATVGQLDADALFYLRSRGIGHDEAHGLLIRAFAADVLDRIGIEAVRDEVERLLPEYLPATAVL